MWWVVLAAVMVLGPFAAVSADVITTNRFVIQTDEVQAEDVLTAVESAIVDGVIEGDLVIATGSLNITGTITGDVLVATQGAVVVSGVVEGSLRGIARSVTVSGSVGDDLQVAAIDVVVTGQVGRDSIGIANSMLVDGVIGRDVLGRARSMEIRADVGRDVDVTSDSLRIADDADVAGDLVYQSNRPIVLDGDDSIAGQIVDIPNSAPFVVDLLVRLAMVLGVFGFMVGGIAVLWLFRKTSGNAITAVLERPLKSVLVGVAALVLMPVVFGLLLASLVGIPFAMLLLVVMVAGLLFGSVPAVAAAGWKVLGGRGGVAAGFVVGAIVWALILAFIPLFGVAIFFATLALGIGAWLLGVWAHRSPGWPEIGQGAAASRSSG